MVLIWQKELLLKKGIIGNMQKEVSTKKAAQYTTFKHFSSTDKRKWDKELIRAINQIKITGIYL